MGYYEIYEYLMKQLQEIKNEQDYLLKQKDIAVQTKDIALELEVNVRSVRNHIKQMLKLGAIECLKGDNDITEKYYIMKIEQVKKNGNSLHINVDMDCSRNNQSSSTPMGSESSKKES